MRVPANPVRAFLVRAMLALAGLFLVLAPASAQNVQTIKFGLAQNSISPIIMNILIPEYLGYYKAQGLDVQVVPLGSNEAVMAALTQGRIQFGVGVPSFQLPIAARGDKMPLVDFYEYTYPFKYGVVVNPNSPIKSLSDLKGKVVGVSSLGTTDYPVGQALLRLAGLNPKTDVKWLATGGGVTAGQALRKGDVAALIYWDTGFGQIEAAGIPLRYLPLPADTPKVGGLFLEATSQMLQEHPAWAIGLARAVAEGSLFILNNPQAAAYGFIKMYPQAAPKAATLQQQIKAVSIPIEKRMDKYRNYDKSITQWGYINPQQWQDEVSFLDLNGKISMTTVDSFYTNNFIARINQFNPQPVINQAKSFKIPNQ